jgi:hypothetical protein
MTNNDFRKHLSNEKKHRVNRAWQYLKPWQKIYLLVCATWWSMPSVFERIERLQRRVNNWITYHLYPAHWI